MYWLTVWAAHSRSSEPGSMFEADLPALAFLPVSLLECLLVVGFVLPRAASSMLQEECDLV